MKYLFALLFFVLLMSVSSAQNWKELNQAPIKLKYSIPQGWYVGGYMSGKACNCSGATINASKDQTISMVIFSSDKEDTNDLKTQKVWGYSFAPTSTELEVLKTEFLVFEKAMSTWNEDKESTVLRFSTSFNNVQYLVYFWGDFQDITKNARTIETILKSIQGI
ncbi:MULTISPECIES: hypothetical protein [unclassified Aureispira]|uniref:hypothetical protein n=1 Tax=unclassified Aureispira TaxID=2649989 RepID=UPI0006979994|nr:MULTISPECIES: hypothetical protein [unclassified Aureispira]WMX14060.1 hypothetical protein QP953_24715 [Aureispira sp. CCB-E]